jgi:hypothetical protein
MDEDDLGGHAAIMARPSDVLNRNNAARATQFRA